MNKDLKIIIEFQENDIVKKRKCGNSLYDCFISRKYKTCNDNVIDGCLDLFDKICDHIPDFS